MIRELRIRLRLWLVFQIGSWCALIAPRAVWAGIYEGYQADMGDEL